MAETTREFFESLETRIDPARLHGLNASYRFDIAGAGIWRVDVAEGSATVTENGEGGDCIIRMKDEVFTKLRRGELNPMNGFMLGRIKVKGDMSLAVKLKELFL
jgi:putative sterol carrier protein